MAKKVKSYKKNMGIVIDSIKKTKGVEMPDTKEIMKSLPPELIEKVSGEISKTLGGDGFTKYISEFMNIFKIISLNVEMNTAGISALANNIKYFYSTLERIEKNQAEIIKLLKGSNAK